MTLLGFIGSIASTLNSLTGRSLTSTVILYGPGSGSVNRGVKPSLACSINASNEGFNLLPGPLDDSGCIVTLTSFGESLAPGDNAFVVIILNDVGSPTCGAVYLFNKNETVKKTKQKLTN